MSDLALVRAAVTEIETYGLSFVELLEALPDDHLWATTGGLPNSIGVLARHLTGNLEHYFGAALLKNDYHRDRDREFSQAGLPRTAVIAELQNALTVARLSVESVDPALLSQPYTTAEGREYASLGACIIHMAAHFALHYGQADYARHFLKSKAETS